MGVWKYGSIWRNILPTKLPTHFTLVVSFNVFFLLKRLSNVFLIVSIFQVFSGLIRIAVLSFWPNTALLMF